ncbi:MAG: hypothetical protein ACTHJW_08735 [Streptosporangiaceae bacterium]
MADQNQQTNYSAPRETYTVTLKSSTVKGLANGIHRGVAFGPGPSTSRDYCGDLKGAKQSAKPKIDSSYYK